MAVIPLQFTYVPGIMSESEFKKFQLEVASSDETGFASLDISIQPGSWIKTSSGTIINDTEEPLEQTLDVSVSEGSISVEYGCHKSFAVLTSGYISLLSFTKEDSVPIFDEPFTSATEIVFDEFEGNIETLDNSWGLSILITNNGTSFEVDNGFEFTLSRPQEYVERGFYMYPLDYIEELISPDTTNLILNINTSIIETLPNLEDFLEIEDAYYGIWIVGLEADLFLDVRPSSFYRETIKSSYPGLLPAVSCYFGQEDYQYQLLGSGEHSVDLSVFDSYLGGGIQTILIEAFIQPLIS